MFFNIAKYTLLFFPIALILGPFFTNLSVTILGLYYLFFGNKKYLLNKISIFFICFYLFFIFSSIISENVYISLKNSLFLFRYYFFILGVFTLIKIQKNILTSFNYILIVILGFVSIDVFIQLIFGKNIFLFEPSGTGIGRFSGVFGNELILGSFLSRLFPLSLALVFYNLNNFNFKNLFLITLFFLIIGTAVIISGERTSLIYTIGILIFIIIYIKELRKFFLFTSIIFPLVLFSLINFSSDVKKRIVDSTYEQIFTYKIDHSTIEKSFNIFSYGHQKHLETAYLIFKDNYIFGTGPNTFDIVCKDPNYFIIYEGGDSCSNHPHNSYAQLGSETGIIGILYFFIPFVYLSFILFKLIFNKCITLPIIFGNKIYCFKNHHLLMLLSLMITLWPLAPTGSVFNSWLNGIYYLPLGLLAFLFYDNIQNSDEDRIK
tara:strand:- start:162 stop:1460 length:1299 start_codon:yes stop_codon:yes gene_type:complete